MNNTYEDRANINRYIGKRQIGDLQKLKAPLLQNIEEFSKRLALRRNAPNSLLRFLWG